MRSELTYVPALVAMVGVAISVVAVPRSSIESASWNFGAVTNVNHVQHDFVVRNTGDARLAIRRVITSCDSCVKVYLDESIIAPGGSTIAHCVLDTRQLSGDITRQVTLETDDPLTAGVTLELLATLVPLYRVSPVELSVGGAVAQQKSYVEIASLVKLNEPLSLADCDNTNLFAAVVEVARDRYQVIVQVEKPLPRGRSVFGVTVRSQNTNDPPCDIVGRIDFPEDYEVIPSQLTFEAKDEFQTRTLWLRQHGEKAFSLLDAVPSSGEFRCEIDPDPASENYRIYVEATGLAAGRGVARRILLKGVNRQNQAVALPVEITIN
jgi:hypothetical protein